MEGKGNNSPYLYNLLYLRSNGEGRGSICGTYEIAETYAYHCKYHEGETDGPTASAVSMTS